MQRQLWQAEVAERRDPLWHNGQDRRQRLVGLASLVRHPHPPSSYCPEIRLTPCTRGCVTPKQFVNIRAKLTPDGTLDVNKLEGYNELPADFQAKVKEAIEQGHVADADCKGVSSRAVAPSRWGDLTDVLFLKTFRTWPRTVSAHHPSARRQLRKAKRVTQTQSTNQTLPQRRMKKTRRLKRWNPISANLKFPQEPPAMMMPIPRSTFFFAAPPTLRREC